MTQPNASRTAKMPVMTPAEYYRSGFAQFHNGLRVLLNIDAAEFPGPETDWPRFRDNPWRYFISADDDTAWRLWMIVETRNHQMAAHGETP